MTVNIMHEQFHKMFIEQLQDIYSAECQIRDAMPQFIEVASENELKEALQAHYEETKQHVQRLERIMSMLNSTEKGKFCNGMKGIISECQDVVKQNLEGAVKDANLIAAIQKIEHYEIAAYGVLKTFAKHLQLKEAQTELSSIESEECKADKMLTKIAEGGWLTSGINTKAAGA